MPWCQSCYFFNIHRTGHHQNQRGDIHNRTVPTQRSLQVGDKDLSCETLQCTRRWWRHRAANVLAPCTGLGWPILIQNIDARIPPKLAIPPLKLLHPGFRNEAWLESMPPLGQTLEDVVMTMIDDLKEDSDPMVFNIKKVAKKRCLREQ